MHPLVCYSVNTLVFAVTQCSILFQKTKEFNNSIDIVCQNTVKKYESSKLLNACSPAVFFFKIISLITLPSGILLRTFFKIFQCTGVSLQIFMKSFFYKNFLWPKISKVSSLMSANTLLGFQEHFMMTTTYLENQNSHLCFSLHFLVVKFFKSCHRPMKRQERKESFSRGCKFHLPVKSTTWFLRLLPYAGVLRKSGSDTVLWLGCWLEVLERTGDIPGPG